MKESYYIQISGGRGEDKRLAIAVPTAKESNRSGGCGLVAIGRYQLRDTEKGTDAQNVAAGARANPKGRRFKDACL